jgi:hypothetical protein
MSRFSYPQLCCRCSADEPARTWDVQSYDSKPGPGNSIVSITYTCPVPVCSACHRSLTFLWSVCWFAALCVGATGGWFIYQWAIGRPNADTVPLLLNRGMPILFGVIIAGGCAWLLKGVFINYDFVHFDPDRRTMVFNNQQYQAVFDEINNLGERSWG